MLWSVRIGLEPDRSNSGKDESKREVMFCPVCGSLDIDWVGGLYILSPHRQCKKCGHRGAFIMGELEFAKKIREGYLAKKESKS